MHSFRNSYGLLFADYFFVFIQKSCLKIFYIEFILLNQQLARNCLQSLPKGIGSLKNIQSIDVRSFFFSKMIVTIYLCIGQRKLFENDSSRTGSVGIETSISIACEYFCLFVFVCLFVWVTTFMNDSEILFLEIK